MGWDVVVESHRGNGLQSELISKRLEYAKQLGVKKVYATIQEGNEKSKHNYEKHGFVKEGIPFKSARGGEYNIVLYIKELSKINKDPEKLKEYKQRHGDWRNIAVNQFSTANNVLITISIGLFALCANINKSGCHYEIISLNVISIVNIILALSILFGIGVLFSRLYDARISRHLALSRQRVYDRWGELIPDTKDKEQFSSWKRFKNVFRKIEFIESNKIDKDNKSNIDTIRDKYKKLQQQSDMLGKTSWIWMNLQVISLLLSGFMYFICWFSW
jgi:hypothetical protein